MPARQSFAIAVIGLAALTAAPAADAATGDTWRVVSERVNLRAGPSDGANVRSQILQGEQILELRRDGNWLGVRVLRTNEEGWVFADLVEPVAASTLTGGSVGPVPAGFRDLSPEFDRLVGTLQQRLGYALFDTVEPAGDGTLALRMTPEWLAAGSADEHLLAAGAVYQMWKNHQNSAPVRVNLLQPGGQRYLAIDDRDAAAPLVTLAPED